MKTTNLKAEVRTELTKAHNNSLRRNGRLPGVIYDNASATHVSIDTKALTNVLYSRDTYILNLAIEGGDDVQAIVREVQYHPVTEKPLHIDLLRVTEDREVILQLPITLTGVPVGVSQGGKLVTKLRFIKVKGVPSKLPDSVSVDVTELELGNTIKVKDAGITDLHVITSPNTGVASVEIPRALRSAGAAAEGEEAAEGEAAAE